MLVPRIERRRQQVSFRPVIPLFMARLLAVPHHCVSLPGNNKDHFLGKVLVRGQLSPGGNLHEGDVHLMKLTFADAESRYAQLFIQFERHLLRAHEPFGSLRTR